MIKVLCRPNESTVGFYRNHEETFEAIRAYMSAPAARGLSKSDFVLIIY